MRSISRHMLDFRATDDGSYPAREWQLWESKTVADMPAPERRKRDPDAISEPDWRATCRTI